MAWFIMRNDDMPDGNPSVTWRAPDKNESVQLKKEMAKKTARILLYSAVFSCYLILVTFIRDTGLPMTAVVLLTFAASVTVVIYFWLYRSAMLFGERLALDDDIGNRSAGKFLWMFLNFIPLAPLFMVFADKLGIFRYILIAVMALLTYWKEFFMLILFVMGKYTVKDGDVFYKKQDRGFSSGYHFMYFSLVYQLEFEDAAGRNIPVMVDRYTYRKIKEQDKAILINYRYGDNYMFEIVRAAK